MENFQKRLIQAMDTRNITAAELSRRTGISKPRISQYVNGIYEAKADALTRLSRVLDVSPRWLMGQDVPMDEMDISQLFQRLTDTDQQKVMDIITAMLGSYR